MNTLNILGTYLPTVMWKFPATLLTYIYPWILQAVREAELSSLLGITTHDGGRIIL